VKVYVVYCHPDPESFTAAIRQRAIAGLQAVGHEVLVTDLYDDGFEPALSLQERVDYLAAPEIDSAIAEYCERLRWCEALVFIYPTWWSGQPGMLTGWLDRVLVRGVAWDLAARDLERGVVRLRPQLTNVRRLVTITTHGSSKWINLLEGETGRRVIGRAVRVLCHRFARTSWLAMYGIDRSTPTDREAFLHRVHGRMQRL
jgi:putative NADPH-quinone reductase